MTEPAAGAARAAPSRRARLAIALAVAVASGVCVYLRAARGLAIAQDQGSDFDPVWLGARALLHGLDPYALLTPAVKRANAWGLYYPMPALLVALPTALLPLAAARAVFFGTSSALLAYGITREGYSRLPVFASMAFVEAAWLVQWSPLLTAAALLPWAAGLLIVKPNIGAALGATLVERRAVLLGAAGAAVLVAASFAVRPTWVGDWLGAIGDTSHLVAPIARPGGVLIALALLRWRRADAWLVLLLACVPQTPGPYEAIPLFLVACTFRESAVLAYLTYALFILAEVLRRDASVQAWMAICGQLEIPLVYLPCVMMVLRRPNQGALPAWLDWSLGRLRSARSVMRRTA